MKEFGQRALVALIFVWQFRNPKANRATFWTHFGSAMLFEKVDKFQ